MPGQAADRFSSAQPQRLVSGRRQRSRKLEPGTVIVIPPEVKHWHGAKADSWFSHIAFEAPGTETSNEWLEAVDDEAYSKLQ